MQKRIGIGLVIVAGLAVAALSGCTASTGQPANDPTVHPLSTLRNDLPGGELTKQHTFKDEPFTITSAYSTTYNTKAWKITDSKILHFSVRLAATDPGTIVMVEHVHADVGLSATKEAFNGMPQDTIDDHLHTGTDAGVQITAAHSYDDDFSIEGYSQTLMSGWGYMAGGYGAFQLDDTRLTEHNLRGEGGVTGNKFIFVYKLLVKGPKDTYFHDEEFSDEFLVGIG